MYDSAIIKYSCRLMDRRMAIGYGAMHRRFNAAEQAELEWISIRMKLVRVVQILRRE